MVDAAAKALSLSALMERTGLPRATAFRLLATLEQCGYVVKDGVDYSLGFKLFVLGNVVAEGLDLRRVAHRHLEALRDATGETVQLAVLEDWQIVHLDRAISNQAVAYMVSHVGAILPAYCTALGKALLAYQSEDLVDAWASTQELRRRTSNTITTAEGLLEELRRIRERGYSIDDEEREVGVRCVGALAGERLGAGPPDARPAAGDDRHLAVQATAHDRLPASCSASYGMDCPSLS